jgi:hypothetical protein
MSLTKIQGNMVTGVPAAGNLNTSEIGIVAGTIRQDDTDRTKWYFINDVSHEPVGVSGTYATASGGTITLNYDTTYSEVISMVVAPDETFANQMNISCGGSVGLSRVLISASSAFTGAFTLEWTGSAWSFISGTAQLLDPTFVSYNAGTLTLSHDYCRGAASQDQVAIQWIDTTTGNIVTDATPSPRMKALITKTNAQGLFLDGTNNATDINGIDMDLGNFWFYGIFKK